MPRTTVNYTNFAPNSHIADTAGTTIDAALVTNGVAISNADPEHTVLRVTNTATTAKTVTVKAGTGTQSWMAGQGDLAAQVAANTGVRFIGPFTSARFQQAPGSALHVNFEAGFTGTITVFRVPKAWN